MNNDYIELHEKITKAFEQMKSEILIFHKLDEFKKTRAIATAVEICDMFIKGMEMDEE